MDRKKFFIFLILFEFIIISLFSNFNKVSAATTLDWKDLPDGCPTPTDVYNSLPDDQKSLVSPDKYAFYSLTYHRVTNTEVQSWQRYSLSLIILIFLMRKVGLEVKVIMFFLLFTILILLYLLSLIIGNFLLVF